MPPQRVTWPQVLALRQRRQHLAERAGTRRALAVTADIAGLHAQLAASAELTLQARVDGLKRDYVSDALWKRRTLVKTWSIRGTLHLLPAAELPLWTAAQSQLKPRHHVNSWLKYWSLTRAQADAMLDAIPQALDGDPLTRDELASGGRPDREGRRARGGAAARVRRPAQARGVPRRPVLRAERGTQRALHAAGPLARPAGARRPRARDAGDRPPLPRRLRPRHARVVRALVRHDLARRGRPLAAGARRRGGDGRARRRGAVDAGRRRRGRGGAGARRPPSPRLRPVRDRRPARSRRRARGRRCATACTARAAGSRRCCWPAAGWPASGATSAKATGSWSRSSRSPSSPRPSARPPRPRPSALGAFLGGTAETRYPA